MGKEKLVGRSELERPQRLQALCKGVSQRDGDGQQKYPQSKGLKTQMRLQLKRSRVPPASAEPGPSTGPGARAPPRCLFS